MAQFFFYCFFLLLSLVSPGQGNTVFPKVHAPSARGFMGHALTHWPIGSVRDRLPPSGPVQGFAPGVTKYPLRWRGTAPSAGAIINAAFGGGGSRSIHRFSTGRNTDSVHAKRAVKKCLIISSQPLLISFHSFISACFLHVRKVLIPVQMRAAPTMYMKRSPAASGRRIRAIPRRICTTAAAM